MRKIYAKNVWKKNIKHFYPEFTKFDSTECKVQINIYLLFKCVLETERITKLNSRDSALAETFS